MTDDPSRDNDAIDLFADIGDIPDLFQEEDGFILARLASVLMSECIPEARAEAKQKANRAIRRWWERQGEAERAAAAQACKLHYRPEADPAAGRRTRDDLSDLQEELFEIQLQDAALQLELDEMSREVERRVQARLAEERARRKPPLATEAIPPEFDMTGEATAPNEASTEGTGRYLLDPGALKNLPEGGKQIERNAALHAACAGLLPYREIRDRDLFARIRHQLGEKYPHATSVIDGLLRPLERNFDTGEARLKLRPTILVGAPGTGKTALLRDLAAGLDLPIRAQSVAGQTDSNLFGVSAGWSSALPSIMTTVIAAVQVLNPLIVLDELDKAQTSHNGSIQESLLPLLEPLEAGHYHERYLASAVDASHLNWIFTANTLERITVPLLSRCDVFEMPQPDVAHVAPLARSILRAHADSLGLQPGFFHLTQGDLEFLEKTFPQHRSIRVLAELVRQLITDSGQGMAHA
ncbi:MAG: AAA family ATPase [Limimaricola soesokkakensis]|uniref:AAA family ATPase n=1 Tax=Limimaricola soesokkakensis TaxID=1343159 RepID=UPI004058D0C2